MPETQAKSGGTGASATPDGAAPEQHGAAVTGRESAGPPADAPSPPKFTRAPGMNPPPGEPPAADTEPAEAKRPAAGKAAVAAPAPPKGGTGTPTVAKGSASVPVVTKGKGAAPGTAASRPAAPAATNATNGAKSATNIQRPPTVTPPASPAQPGAAKQRPNAATGSAAVGAARVSEAVRTARSTVSNSATRGPRRARLNLKRIDPWSVMKFSFAVSVVLFIVVVVATSVLYLALDAMGVWGSVNNSLKEFVSASGGNGAASSGGGFRVTAWGVIGTSMLIGAVNVVLFTALATLGAFIYNVCADLVGGLELTLAERD